MAILSPANLELNLYLPLAFWEGPHLICVHKMFVRNNHISRVNVMNILYLPSLKLTAKSPQNRPLENLETGISRVKLLVFRELYHLKKLRIVPTISPTTNPGPDDHIHRIGRTGRAGVPGRAVTFLDSRESKEAREVGCSGGGHFFPRVAWGVTEGGL